MVRVGSPIRLPLPLDLLASSALEELILLNNPICLMEKWMTPITNDA